MRPSRAEAAAATRPRSEAGTQKHQGRGSSRAAALLPAQGGLVVGGREHEGGARVVDRIARDRLAPEAADRVATAARDRPRRSPVRRTSMALSSLMLGLVDPEPEFADAAGDDLGGLSRIGDRHAEAVPEDHDEEVLDVGYTSAMS